MASSSDDEGEPLAFSEDLVSSPTHKAAGTSTVDFDGLLQTPLKLHEDLTQGCGGQLWPAGMVLGKYMLRDHQKETLRSKTMFVSDSRGCTTRAIKADLQPDLSLALVEGLLVWRWH